jgi:toluene monooxygenase system ferredoxin subunit
MALHFAAALDDLWDGEMKGLLLGGTKVLVLRLGDEVHAYLDRCAHLGVRLSEGRFEAGVLTCSAHEYTYDASSGRGLNPERTCLVSFPVQIDAGRIMVEVP